MKYVSSARLFGLYYVLFFRFSNVLLIHAVNPDFHRSKKMLKAYFREPYFNAFELNFFTGPNAFFRTAKMLKLAVWPDGLVGNGHTRTHTMKGKVFLPLEFQTE